MPSWESHISCGASAKSSRSSTPARLFQEGGERRHDDSAAPGEWQWCSDLWFKRQRP
jgi:hypothetical protein